MPCRKDFFYTHSANSLSRRRRRQATRRCTESGLSGRWRPFTFSTARERNETTCGGRRASVRRSEKLQSMPCRMMTQPARPTTTFQGACTCYTRAQDMCVRVEGGLSFRPIPKLQSPRGKRVRAAKVNTSTLEATVTKTNSCCHLGSGSEPRGVVGEPPFLGPPFPPNPPRALVCPRGTRDLLFAAPRRPRRKAEAAVAAAAAAARAGCSLKKGDIEVL